MESQRGGAAARVRAGTGCNDEKFRRDGL